jgi:hypothetical protein
MSETGTGAIRFEDWRTKAAQLLQNYQTANASFRALTAAALEDSSLRDAAYQAGLQSHAAAREYNQFLGSGNTASKLSLDIYNRLNAQGGPPLSPIERLALETQRQQLTDFAQQFGEFLAQQQMRPVWPDPVNQGGKTTFADGRSEWDYSIQGWWGRAVEWASDLSTAVGDAFRGAASSPNNYESCKYAWEQLQGALLKGPLAAPGKFPGWPGIAAGQMWDDTVNKSFPNSPAEATCRLIWPKGQVPESIRLYGMSTDSFNPALGDLTAFDVPASLLATVAVGDMLASQVAKGIVSQADATAWLRQASGDTTATLPTTYARPSTGYHVAAVLPLDLDLFLWTDGGPMAMTPWSPPTQTVEYGDATTTSRETDIWGKTTTTVSQIFDDGSSLTTTQLPDGMTRTISRDSDGRRCPRTC